MVIIILLRSSHLLGGDFASITYDIIPTTLTMGGFLVFQPILFTHISLTFLTQIEMSLIILSNGILKQIFFNYFINSKLMLKM